MQRSFAIKVGEVEDDFIRKVEGSRFSLLEKHQLGGLEGRYLRIVK